MKSLFVDIVTHWTVELLFWPILVVITTLQVASAACLLKSGGPCPLNLVGVGARCMGWGIWRITGAVAASAAGEGFMEVFPIHDWQEAWTVELLFWPNPCWCDVIGGIGRLFVVVWGYVDDVRFRSATSSGHVLFGW